MNTGIGIFFIVFGICLFVISFFQFQEKGFIFNRSYIWAPKEKRQEIDDNEETKRLYYHQSAFVSLLLGISFITFSIYLFLNIFWIFILFAVIMIITLIYGVISTIKINRHK